MGLQRAVLIVFNLYCVNVEETCNEAGKVYVYVLYPFGPFCICCLFY